MAATHPDVLALRRRFGIPADDGEALFLSRLYPGGPQPADVSLVGPFMGAPQAAMLMETLAAWGVRRIVFLGWCGALASSVKSGDVIVPQGAFADEGTSPAYGCESLRVAPASPAFQSQLSTHLRQNGLTCQEGWIWTTDAVFRETTSKVRHYQSLGALAVEMELSALYSVSRHCGIELGAVLVVSDELSSFKWRPGFKSERFQATRTAVCEAIGTYVERSPS
ncbi:MAG: nucleoside phosphorylase [Desulfobacterales bacterium]|jgi:uridine phosphorylase